MIKWASRCVCVCVSLCIVRTTRSVAEETSELNNKEKLKESERENWTSMLSTKITDEQDKNKMTRKRSMPTKYSAASLAQHVKCENGLLDVSSISLRIQPNLVARIGKME